MTPTKFRFAIISDLHIALPTTIRDHPSRLHRVEISILALEQVLTHLETLNLDFLLIPGDLTQDGEPENHAWLQQRLQQVPFPVYVIPGNHDVPTQAGGEHSIGFQDFPRYYPHCGYDNPSQLYYSREILPGVQLIALNSNDFDASGQQIGAIAPEQWDWFEQALANAGDRLILVMIHHNVIEHLPGQTHHKLGKRYMLQEATALLDRCQAAGVKLIFTGHLHVQDIAQYQDIYEITTGSLVSYPHPYRVLEMQQNDSSSWELQVQSYRVEKLAGEDNFGEASREWMGDRSEPFMLSLLSLPPLNIDPSLAQKLIPKLRYFWADIAQGDGIFDFPEFPESARQFFRDCSALDSSGRPALVDNQVTLQL
jgi:3',5'-cyclic AMP phosphodiesterase CpdA